MKIAVFDAVGTYFSAPTLRCILEELDANGAEVDVFLRFGGERLIECCKAAARPFPVRLKPWTGDVESTLRNWKWFFKYRGWRGQREVRAKSYDLAIGLNPEGVIAAHRLWKLTGTPYAYLSFELMFRDELPRAGQQREKTEEVAASRDAALIIIQDRWRAQLLSDENGVPIEKMEFLPVSPRGAAPAARNNYLRERYNIGPDQTVVLHSGSFGDFTRADELMDVLPRWPEDFVLVVNTFYSPDREDRYLARLRDVGLKHVRLACGALSHREYQEMLCSADIGLAFYKHAGTDTSIFSGRNIEIMGLSSGKLSSYAQSGLPIICVGNSQLKEFMAQYRFGEYAEDLRLLPELLEKVRADWSAYSTGARRFFQEQLDFDRFWPGIWKKLSAAAQLNQPKKAHD